MRMRELTLDLCDYDIRHSKLYDIADKIIGLLGDIKQTERQIGVLLQQAWDRLGGDKKLFGDWRTLNFSDQQLKRGTAYNYRMLAKLPEDTGNIKKSSLYKLAEDANLPHAEAIIDRFKKLEKVSGKMVEDALADAKDEPRQTRTEARHKSDDEKVDAMFFNLCGMGRYNNQRMIELIANHWGRLRVTDWVNTRQGTALPLLTQLVVAQINEAWYKAEYERLLAETGHRCG